MPATKLATPMKVAQIASPGADFQIVEREIPKPGVGQVRIKVQACGICHSDVLTKEGALPGIQYPRVPGHEVAGVIDELGAEVTAWKLGQRVGVGWHGGQDGTCDSCRRGDFRNCRNLKIPGISYDGGYQEYMVAPVEALALEKQQAGRVQVGCVALGRAESMLLIADPVLITVAAVPVTLTQRLAMRLFVLGVDAV